MEQCGLEQISQTLLYVKYIAGYNPNLKQDSYFTIVGYMFIQYQHINMPTHSIYYWM